MREDRGIERHMSKEALPGFFRELADALEQGGGGEFESVGEFYRLKVSVRDEFGQLRVKLKIKTTGDSHEGRSGAKRGGGGMPKYKDLKKRMKRNFKTIRRALGEGQAPPAEATASFLADSELMTGYPGKGDEFYEDFRQACRAFSEACASGDLGRMGAAAEELNRQKRRCHDRYK